MSDHDKIPTDALASTADSISPETLMNAVIELEEAYNHYKNDPGSSTVKLTELFKRIRRPSQPPVLR